MTAGALYTIRIKRSAEREMDDLPTKMFERISQALLKLESNPRPHGCQKLRGQEAYRVRVGIYRVLYSIHEGKREVEVFAVDHRKDAYR